MGVLLLFIGKKACKFVHNDIGTVVGDYIFQVSVLVKIGNTGRPFQVLCKLKKLI